ncbi:MAG: translation initiation factor IF-2 [Desulfobacterales bacterium]|nr:translation initiation factor IF-2 [Desulfobacterales bacterium]
MAKIRVYELARNLNMTNRALINKIKDMGISATSHMSSLEDDTVEQIRGSIFGPKTDNMVVTRIKPTVIRRRRKVVKARKKPAPPPEVEAEPTPEVEVKPAAEKEVAAPKEAPPAEPAGKVEKKKAPTAEARIIAPPKKETPEEKAPAPAMKVKEKPAETPAAPEKAKKRRKVKKGAEAPGKAKDQKEQKDLKDRKERKDQADQKERKAKDKKPRAGKKEKKEEAKKPSKKASRRARAKKARKARKETPAKIVKLPEAPAQPEPGDGAAKPAEADAKKGPHPKKKGKRRRPVETEEPSRDKKFMKKKISFRKKEVVEGSALYTKRRRGRGRKRGKGKMAAPGRKTQITTPKAIKRRVKIDDTIVLSDLAKRMGIKANEMIKTLMGLGVMATVNQTIDFDTAVLVAAEFDYELEKASFEEEVVLMQKEDQPGAMVERPPVVTIMGHVDHGKAALLDVIRKTHVTDVEAGGITQHIGAYHVDTEKGPIVFLDTPGHEAFTAMRVRGATVTDLVILVVAADDGVMPQTVEAINHSKAAEVPIIVAINKIDKPNAEPEKVTRQLAEIGLVSEDWGGDTIFLQVSAKKAQGIDDLLEMILLQAEVMELKANPDKLAVGRVVEAKLDSGKGPVATVLVQDGALRTGDAVVCGVQYGKIRALLNDRGVQVDQAGPSIPVELTGLSGVPNAGDEMIVLEDEKDAKQVSAHRIQKQRAMELAKTSRLSLEGLFERMKEGEVKDLNLIIKTDVKGSVEALTDSLVKLSNDEVNIHVIHSGTGAITESDVSLAAVSDAIIIGFNVRPSMKVMDMAQEENVDLRFHNVIYNVIKEVKDAIVGMMSSKFEERILGRADVRQTFSVPKIGVIAGSYVTDGVIKRGGLARLLREGVVMYEGKIGSLRRFKDDAKEVQSGYECGIGIENYNDIKVGDTIECYYMEEIKPEME